jgi:hypothetical protein
MALTPDGRVIRPRPVSRERVRQIEAEALRKLKHPSRSKILRSFLDNRWDVRQACALCILKPSAAAEILLVSRWHANGMSR